MRPFWIACPLFTALLLDPGTAAAQKRYRFEVSGLVGYNFSGGFDVDPVQVGGTFYDHLTAKNGLAYGASFGVFTNPKMMLEFNWSQQQSEFQGSGPTATTSFTDMNISNYHGNFVFHGAAPDDKVRPFFLFGLGATSFSFSEYQGTAIEGSTEFSATIGGGVKVYSAKNVGLKLQARLTPTYIGSTSEGMWCGFYGCWPVSSSKFLTQFELSAGLLLRF